MRFFDFKLKKSQIKVGQEFGKVKLVGDEKSQRWSHLMMTCHNYDYLSIRLLHWICMVFSLLDIKNYINIGK